MKAKANYWKGHIVLRTEQEPGDNFQEIVAKSKAVPGARWKKAERWWQYPASVETCHALRKIWGSDLQVMSLLGEWYTEQKAAHDARTEMANLRDAELARLPDIAPKLYAALRPDQRVGAAWVARGYRGAGLLCDEPGLGKTLEAIAGVLEADIKGPVLIVCPKLSVKPVWYRELTRWTNESVHIARGTRQQRLRAIEGFFSDNSERKFLVIVAEMLRIKEEPMENNKTKFAGYEYEQLFLSPWSAVIVDESHKLFGSLTVVKGNLAGKGLKRLPVVETEEYTARLAATGTPFGKGGRLQGMFGTLHWLWPDEYTSFWRWAETNFEIEEEEIYVRGGGGRTRTTRKVGKLRQGNEEEFLHSFGPRILRRTKLEILPDLPPKQYVEVLCEMESQQLKQYKQLSLEAEIVCQNGVITANGALAEMTRAKQVANGVLDVNEEGRAIFTDHSCKIEMLMQALDNRGILDGSGTMKVIVASQFNEFLEAVQRRLAKEKVAFHIITGKTSDRNRDEAMAQFQAEGGARVFLLNSKAGGISVTLDAADEVHCLDEMFDPSDQQQLEDRAHRASRNHQVTVYHYRTEGTIDFHIKEDVEGKRILQHGVLDGRRGLEYARNLIRYRAPSN